MSSSQTSRDNTPNRSSSGKPFSLSLGGSSGTNGSSKKASFNFKSSSRAPDSSSRTLARRPHQLHHDDDSEEEESAPTHQAVTGFDTNTGSAISADGQSSEKRELVIPVTSKNNWRDRAGTNHAKPKGKNLLPQEVQAMQEAQRRGEDIGGNFGREGPSMSYGLSFAQPKTEEDGDQPMKDAGPEEPAAEEKRKPLTQDEIALKALIRDSKGETEGRSDLVIESAKRDEEDGDAGGRYDETSSFRTDIRSRPDAATLDQYNAIPVEEFGAALLRGMGWKDGQSIGRGNYGSAADAEKARKPRIPERRPGYLGIGAKDTSGGKGAEAELGAWGKSAMRKGARKAGEGEEGKGSTEGVYMPVMMRNKKTGEYVTEEELATLQKEAKAKKDDDEWKDRRDRNLEKSGRDRDRDRDRDYRRRDYDKGDDSDRYERRKTGSSRRDRSLSSSERHSRRKRYDDEDGSGKDDRYYRDRDRDRDRRDRDKDRSRDRSSKYRDDDRYSSSRHSSSRRDRDRDRDRDSDRDSYRRRRRDDR